MKNQIKKLKNFLCKIYVHNWKRMPNHDRECRWCKEYEYYHGWEGGVQGSQDAIYKSYPIQP